MTDARTLKRHLEEASAVVASARQTLAEGNIVDLTGLEREVEEVCNSISALPGEESGTLRTALISLADDLDLLKKSLGEMHEKLAAEIEGTDARHRAAKAYGGGQAKGK